MKNNKIAVVYIYLAIILTLSVFTVDLIIPLGVAFGVLYALPVLITFKTNNNKTTILLATSTTILTLIGYYNSPHGGEEWKVIFNRSISIFIIWSVALSILYYYKLVKNSVELNGKLMENNLLLNQLKSILHETNTLAKIGSWELNLETNDFFWSDTIKEILEEPLTYKPNWETSIRYFKKGESAKMVYDFTKKAIEEGSSFDITTQVFTAKGKVLWLRIIGKTEKKGGKHFRLYGSLQDITDRKNSEDKLKLALEETKDIKVALNRSAILAYTDVKGKIVYVNDKFTELSKYSKEELIGADHRILNSGYHSKEFMQDLWTTIKSGKVWRGEIKNKAKDGSFYWVKSIIVPSISENGKITQFISIRYDITDRKNAELIIKKHQENLEDKNIKLEKIAWSFSHNVRAPIVTIMGLSNIFNYENDCDQFNKEIIGKIQKPINSLNKIVSSIVKDINDIN